MVTECELDLGTVLFVITVYYYYMYVLLLLRTLICIYTFYGMHFLMLSYLVIICDTLHISSH